jgi:hypothetical protein
VRRWVSRFNAEGMAGLANRSRSGRPRLGGRRLTRRIAELLARPGLWTLPRTWRYLAGRRSARHLVPAGAAGDLAAAETGRPRRPGHYHVVAKELHRRGDFARTAQADHFFFHSRSPGQMLDTAAP